MHSFVLTVESAGAGSHESLAQAQLPGASSRSIVGSGFVLLEN